MAKGAHLARILAVGGAAELVQGDVGESMQNPSKYWRNNVSCAVELLDAMARVGVYRIVSSRSAAIYGKPRQTPIPEDHHLSGILSSGDTGEDHDPETHLIPIVLKTALGLRQRLSIFGTDYPTPDGTCVRDYVHVSDLAEAHLAALERLEGQAGALAYNLGNGARFSVREVLRCAERIVGRPIPAVEDQRRPGDPAVPVASSELAQRELGWTPAQASLERTMASAWAWHSAAPGGYNE